MYDSGRLDAAMIQRVWQQARVIAEFDPDDWRQDQCGAWMRRDHCDNAASEFGWRILDVVPDHPDEPDTLRAFHILNTFDVARGQPVCRTRADRRNIAAGTAAAEPHNLAVSD
jgi:hypothetical protein